MKKVILSKLFRHRMLNQNKNILVIIVGATGSGKSYAALRLAETTDPNFDISRVMFSPQDFMLGMKNMNHKAGDCFVWDEAGVGLGARDFMTRSNKAMNRFLQSFRKMNLGLFFTLPSLNMLDSQARALAHYIIEPVSVNKTTNTCRIKFYYNQQNARSGKVYNKSQRFYDGGVNKVSTIRIHKPSVKLVHRYEDSKHLFLQKLMEDVQTKLDEPVKKVGYTRPDFDKIIAEVIKNKDKFIRKRLNREYFDMVKIQNKYNISQHNAQYIKNEATDRVFHGQKVVNI